MSVGAGGWFVVSAKTAEETGIKKYIMNKIVYEKKRANDNIEGDYCNKISDSFLSYLIVQVSMNSFCSNLSKMRTEGNSLRREINITTETLLGGSNKLVRKLYVQPWAPKRFHKSSGLS